MTDCKDIYDRTDLGNAQRFADQNKDKLKVISGTNQWIKWNGCKWESTPEATVYQAAIKSIKAIESEGSNFPIDQVMELRRWCKESQSHARLRAMVSLASKLEQMNVRQSDFDNHVTGINTPAGFVSIHKGEAKMCSGRPLVAKVTNADFNAGKDCPRFQRFLQEVFEQDQELISWMQRALGYSILGNTDEQCLFIAYGQGANGKSTLFEVIREILGDYAKVTDFELFLNNHKSDVRLLEAVGELAGIRFALASEVDSNKRFSDSVIKRLTGGDTLRGTKLRQSSFEFKPQFKLWFLANHLPFAKDGSHGFWRRIKVVPFNRKFTLEERDPSLINKLLEERDGILSWLIEGAASWSRQRMISGGTGLDTCDAVDNATTAYRDDNDFISLFISERILEAEGQSIRARELYDAYQLWSDRTGEPIALSENLFSRRMEERGLKKTRSKDGQYYRGICLNGHSDF